MWIVLFIVAVLFVLGSALILLRSAKMPKIPDNVKSQPYKDDDSSDDWYPWMESSQVELDY